jgi:putative transcriptional regulator
LIYKRFLTSKFLNRKIVVTQHPSYSYKGSLVLWKLREAMARRKITNKALADELSVHPTSISRLKTQDVLPEIGGEVLGQLIDAIDKLSAEKYGHCTLTELIELVADNQH